MTDERQQHWTEHLGELRMRILWTLATFVVGLIIGLGYAGDIVSFLKQDAVTNKVSMHVFSPGEALSIYMQFAFVVSIVFTLPMALYQMWRFVQPGLTEREQKATLTYIPFALILLLLGIAFGYGVIFPFLLSFMANLTAALGAQETYGMAQYFQFMFRIVVPIALLFELPVVILFLTRIRILKPGLLRKGRRFAYLAMVILAALITPPDFVSNVLVAIPLIVLYEFSILLSSWVYRKMEKEEAEEEAHWRERERYSEEDE
jgi:sec-independent protein translocase protein TatC